MTMSASAFTGRNTVSPCARDLARRFQPSSNADGNAGLACDPEGYASVSDEALETVDYERPAFNWPRASLPESNYFVIDSMAMDVLNRSGFSREARSLKTRSTFDIPAFDDLPTLLHHYLDFAPAAALEGDELQEFKRLAEKMGLDADAALNARKKGLRNPLAHPAMPLAREWEWLVEKADVKSQFGKTAACELSPSAILALSSRWLDEMASGVPALPANDPAFANRAWFESRFPQGWIRVDHLHETAIVSSGFNFADQMTPLLYEMASKTAKGRDARDVARFAFNHLNAVGVNGAAVMAQGAFEYLGKTLAPQIISPRAAPPASTPLARFIAKLNPALSELSDAEALWAAYRNADPEGAREVERIFQEQNAKLSGAEAPSKSDKAALLAGMEKLILASADLNITPGSASAPRPPRAGAMRV